MRADGMSKVHDEPLKCSSEVKTGQGYSMASDWENWTGTIDVAVTEANVLYCAIGTDPDAHGAAEISGNALLRNSLERTELRFPISLAIHGKPASQAKREADENEFPWPEDMNEITDGVIGILFKAEVNELRRGRLYLHPAQFDKLMGDLAIDKKIRFYSRQGVQSECDLIVRVDVWTKIIAPQS
jgi:hypothetical protein